MRYLKAKRDYETGQTFSYFLAIASRRTPIHEVLPFWHVFPMLSEKAQKQDVEVRGLRVHVQAAELGDGSAARGAPTTAAPDAFSAPVGG